NRPYTVGITTWRSREMTSQPTKWYRHPSVWVGLIISAASIALLLRLIDIPDLIEKLEQAELRWILLAFAAACLTPFIRAARWQAILGPKVGYWKTFNAENIGYLLNVVLPLRAGEPARAYIISRTQPDV